MPGINDGPVHELIGTLSEGIIWCSYNEDDIREMWKTRTLNQRISELDRFDKERFDDMAICWVVKNDDYQSLLTEKIIEAGGWPKTWSSARKDLSPLSKKEITMCVEWKLNRPPTLGALSSGQQLLDIWSGRNSQNEKA